MHRVMSKYGVVQKGRWGGGQLLFCKAEVKELLTLPNCVAQLSIGKGKGKNKVLMTENFHLKSKISINQHKIATQKFDTLDKKPDKEAELIKSKEQVLLEIKNKTLSYPIDENIDRATKRKKKQRCSKQETIKQEKVITTITTKMR